MNLTRLVRSVAILLLAFASTGMADEPKEPEFDGKPLSYWIKQLYADTADARMEAADAIAEMGPTARAAVPGLLYAFKTAHADVSTCAAMALAQIGREAQDAVPELVAALKNPDLAIRAEAAGALWSIAKHRDVVPALIAALKDPRGRLPGRAAFFLGEIGKDAKPAVPVLLELLKDPTKWYVRADAAVALWRIEKHRTAHDAIVEMIKGNDTDTTFVVAGLAQAGPEAKAFVPVLKSLQGALSPAHQWQISTTIEVIEGKGKLKLLSPRGLR